MSDYFKDKEPSDLRGRIFFTAVIVAAAFFILLARFWYLQVKESEYYADLSKNNRIRSVKSPAPRGVIYDKNGVKLVENRPGFDLYLVPEDVKDWAKIKYQLKTLLDIPEEAINDRLEQSEDRPPFQAVKLKEDLSWEETVKIESFKFEMPGVILEVSPKRHYIYSEAFAHLMGYLGEVSDREMKELKDKKYAAGDLIGKYGLEKSLENDLRGVDGSKDIEVDALGRKINIASKTSSYPGSDVRLTIDIRAQIAAWDAMMDKAGAVVAIEPQTGKILAFVSAPAFDPNVLSSGLTKDVWNDLIENPLNILMSRPIQGLYPPASTFKPIHAAAALEEKIITPKTSIYSGPSFWFAGREYRDWKEEGHGTINVHRAIVESSDTFFYQVGLKMGVNRLAEYAKGFGFGKKTGIPLQNEKSGVVPSTEWKKAVYKTRWYDGETISVSVGQGYMLATPLQLATAYAAIANGGRLYTPQLIEEIQTPAGKVTQKFAALQRGNLNVSEGTLAYVKEALKGVVHEAGGTAGSLKYAKLDIAGKTGTAQVSKLIKRTKNIKSIAYNIRDHAWFAGYAPYDNPKIAVAVIVEHGGFGASAAAPVALQVFKAYLNQTLDPNAPAPPPAPRPEENNGENKNRPAPAMQAAVTDKEDDTND